MWPWDHLAVGYLVVSLWRRHRSGRPPREAEAVAVVIGSQLPDLIDKPLGWGTTLLPTGHSFAHSLSVAVPTAVIAYLLADRFGRADVGVAFSLAYLSHLPGDVFYPMVLGDSPNLSFLFWPFVDVPASQTDALAGRVIELFVEFVEFLATPNGLAFLAVEMTLLFVTFLMWRQDGWPGLGAIRRAIDARSA